MKITRKLTRSIVNTLQVGTIEVEIEGKNKRFLVFDNEAFDYELIEADLSRAIMFCGNTPESKKSLHGEIQSHFLASLSEFLGWNITLEELMIAIQEGQIEKKVS